MKAVAFFVTAVGLCIIAFFVGGWVPLTLFCVLISAIKGTIGL